MADEEKDMEDVLRELNDVKVKHDQLKKHIVSMETQNQTMSNNKVKVTGDEEHNVSNRLRLMVANLFNNQLFSDVAILLNGGIQIKAHKLILAASGDDWGVDGFEKIDMLDLTDVRYEVGYTMIRWVYTDEFEFHNKIDESFLIELLQASAVCKLSALHLRCQKALSSILTPVNCKRLYEISSNINAVLLMGYCQKLVEAGQFNEDTLQPKPEEVYIDVAQEDQKANNGEIQIKTEEISLTEVQTSTSLTEVKASRSQTEDKSSQCSSNQHIPVKNIPAKTCCSVCGKIFQTVYGCRNHRVSYPKTGHRSCLNCGKTFSSESNLYKHSCLYSSKPIKDARCNLETLSNQMKPNVQLELSPQKYKCEVCSKTFKKSIDYDRHLKIHSGDKPYKCEICNHQFVENFHLTVHMRRHSGEKPYRCEICDKEYISKVSLKYHTNSHKNITYTCPFCDKCFKVYKSFLHHKTKHGDQKTYKCDTCKMTFKLLEELEQHIHEFQGKDHSSCEMCLSIFLDKKKLEEHSCNSLLPDVMEEYHCKACSKSYRTRAALRLHNQTKHKGLKPYYCHICDKSFSSLYFYSHMKIHSGISKFKCHVCNRLCISKAELTQHLRVHTGERVCSCDLCGKQFKNKSHLASHVKSHLKIRPHQCDICSKTFRDSNDLKIHKRIHTGEKPFSCEICQSSFRSTSALNFHTKSHYTQKSNERHPCPFCSKTFTTKYNRNTHIHKLHKKADLSLLSSLLAEGDSKTVVDPSHVVTDFSTVKDIAFITDTASISGDSSNEIVDTNNLVPSVDTSHIILPSTVESLNTDFNSEVLVETTYYVI